MRNFSDIIVPDGLIGIDPSPEAAKRFIKETTRQLLSTFDRSIERWGLTPQETRLVDAMVGRTYRSQNLLSSNLALRNELGSHLIDLLNGMELAKPKRRFYLVTMLSDRWLSFDRYTQIWLGGMKSAVRQVMRLGTFAGWIGLVELQTMDETVRFFGRILLPHGHFIAWTDNPDFDPEESEAKMAASGRLESLTGAATVTVRSDPSTSVCNMAAYVMKAAALAKRRLFTPSSPSGFILDECLLPPVSAVRQAEILSQTTFDELMLSGGDGGRVRTELVRFMYRARPRSSELDTEQAARFWARCRKHPRRKSYKPVRIDRSGAQLLPNPPIGLACARLPREDWSIAWLLVSGQAKSLSLVEECERLMSAQQLEYRNQFAGSGGNRPVLRGADVIHVN